MRSRLIVKITRPRLKAFLEKQQTKTATLEVGAGPSPYRDLFPNAVSGDIVITHRPDVQFDAHALPFADESFPVVLCTEVLEHCINPANVTDEFYRVLAPNGKLIISTRFVFPIHDEPHDYFRFTKYGLMQLFKQFSAVSIESEASTIETLAVLLQRIGYQVNWRQPVDKLIKVLLFLSAKIIVRLQWLVKEEYGSITKVSTLENIMTSGYYATCIK